MPGKLKGLRNLIFIRWFVRGKEYFSTLLQMMELAVHRICITDWFFSDGTHRLRYSTLIFKEFTWKDPKKALRTNPVD